MPTSVLMPSLSPTMEEGVLTKWLVKEGDFIKPGSMLCSVETDKTTVDYETLDEGFLRKILVPSGSPAKVNQLIAILSESKDEDISEFLKKAQEKSEKLLAGAAKPAANAPAPLATPAPIPAPFDSAQGAGSTRRLSGVEAGGAPVATPFASGDGRIKASPLARKVAAEAGISLGSIPGSGPQGRIVRQDVEAAKSHPASSGESVGVKPWFANMAPAVTQDLPVSLMRKTIAKRLLESAQSMPVFSVTLKVEADALNRFRSELKRGPGFKVSVNDIIVKATALALRQHPAVNASFYGDFIRQYGNVDIGVAVSLDGGLITPIVKAADQKSVWAISEEIKSLVAKARAGKLAPEEYQGGTFTISNLGMYGVDQFTAIINPPQSAILSVGGSQAEVFLDAAGAPQQRQIMKLTLNADHRSIDGALAAQFLSSLKTVLENPLWLMF